MKTIFYSLLILCFAACGRDVSGSKKKKVLPNPGPDIVGNGGSGDTDVGLTDSDTLPEDDGGPVDVGDLDTGTDQDVVVTDEDGDSDLPSDTDTGGGDTEVCDGDQDQGGDTDVGDGDEDEQFYCENEKVLICHYPPGNPENRHELCVDENAIRSHMKHHQDTLGECDE